MPEPPPKEEMLECLERSGYLLEGRLAKTLTSIELFVEPNPSFPDERTGLSREVDMVAESAAWPISMPPNIFVRTTFVLEAINNLYPVALLTRRPGSPNNYDDELILARSTPDQAREDHPFLQDRTVNELKNVYQWQLYSQYCAFSRKKQGGDLMASHPEDLHASIRKAVEYALYVMDNHFEWMTESEDSYWRIFQWRPVIVLQNELYVFEEVDSGHDDLIPVKQAKLAYNFHYRGIPKTVVVDFISEVAIADFVRSTVDEDIAITQTLSQLRSSAAQAP